MRACRNEEALEGAVYRENGSSFSVDGGLPAGIVGVGDDEETVGRSIESKCQAVWLLGGGRNATYETIFNGAAIFADEDSLV